MALLFSVASYSCHLNRKATQPKESQAERLNDLFNHSRVTLTSQKRYGEVDVPFVLRNNQILLKMTWAGKPVEAILDTGSYWIVWPQTLQLSSTKTGVPQVGVMAADITTQGEWQILPSIKVGGCEWRNIPTIASGKMEVQTTRQNKLPQIDPTKAPKPLLGVPAFQNVVLTIDYPKRQIIIRRPEYDITHLPHQPQDRLLSPQWDNGYLPVFSGRLANRPAHFALDTGCGGIAITTKFANLLPPSYSRSTATADINGQPVRIHAFRRISGVVMDSKFLAVDAQIMNVPMRSDALIGTVLLRCSRITIDYARGKILLEPYPGGRK